MATSFTRTQGANARAEGWDDYQEERTQTRGNWVPLADLDGQDVYTGTPRLRARRGQPVS